MGTPLYMSPEARHCRQGQKGTVRLTPKADFWSLGCVLFELCTLQHYLQLPEAHGHAEDGEHRDFDSGSNDWRATISSQPESVTE